MNFLPENRKIKNIFADKATLIPRKMFCHPDEKWVVRDFNGPGGISVGMAQEVLDAMAQKGYVKRIKKGPRSYTLLTDKNNLLHDWTNAYHFDLNRIQTYYSPDKNILHRVIASLRNGSYALTLHSGTGLITSHFKTKEIFIYLKLKDWQEEISALGQQLDLKQLVQGGNIHFIRPFYKNSAFFNAQEIKGFRVVSNLQLYLDLYNFAPDGREQAEHFKQLLAEKGKDLD